MSKPFGKPQRLGRNYWRGRGDKRHSRGSARSAHKDLIRMHDRVDSKIERHRRQRGE